MKVFSRLLSTSRFQLHISLCQVEPFTHLFCADGLMVFYGASEDSVIVINDALAKFRALSGLTTNEKKSEIFFAKSSVKVKERIKNLLGFKRMCFMLISTLVCH